MAKTKHRAAPIPTATERARERKAYKQQLIRAHRLERDIQTLARGLSARIRKTDDALIALAHELAARAMMFDDQGADTFARTAAPAPLASDADASGPRHEHEYAAREASGS